MSISNRIVPIYRPIIPPGVSLVDQYSLKHKNSNIYPSLNGLTRPIYNQKARIDYSLPLSEYPPFGETHWEIKEMNRRDPTTNPYRDGEENEIIPKLLDFYGSVDLFYPLAIAHQNSARNKREFYTSNHHHHSFPPDLASGLTFSNPCPSNLNECCLNPFSKM